MPPLSCRPEFDEDVPLCACLYTEESVTDSKSSPKRRVRLDLAATRLHHIVHVNDLTDTEVQSLWYQDHEFRAMKSRILEGASQIEAIRESDLETARGLEFYARQGGQERELAKRRHRETVLDEWDRQHQEGESVDHDRLARLANALSFSRVQEALYVAADDEDFVLDQQMVKEQRIGASVCAAIRFLCWV
jgi:hypothetical protein